MLYLLMTIKLIIVMLGKINVCCDHLCLYIINCMVSLIDIDQILKIPVCYICILYVVEYFPF